MLFLVATVSQAGSIDAALIHKEAQAVVDQTLERMRHHPELTMGGENMHMGEYDQSIIAIQGQTDQKIREILNNHSNRSKADDSNLFVLVSFSMPDTLIKQYVDEASKYGGFVVIIGLIDNDFSHTKARIAEIVGNSKKGGILIDPNIFDAYKITTVPTIILTADEYPCHSGNCSRDKYDMMQGAISVQYALESFESQGELRNIAKLKLQVES